MVTPGNALFLANLTLPPSSLLSPSSLLRGGKEQIALCCNSLFLFPKLASSQSFTQYTRYYGLHFEMGFFGSLFTSVQLLDGPFNIYRILWMPDLPLLIVLNFLDDLIRSPIMSLRDEY